MSDLSYAASTIKDLTQFQGKNSQAKIVEHLKKNDTPELRYLLKTALDPFIVTHISSWDVEFTNGTEEASPIAISDLALYMDEVVLRGSHLKDVEIYGLWDLVDMIDASREEKVIIAKCLTKTLNVGVGPKIINKAFPKFIPTPQLMLASDSKNNQEKVKQIIESDFVLQIKYDGVRMIAKRVGEGVWKFYTRRFKQLDTENKYLNHFQEELESFYLQLPSEYRKEDLFFDGEFVLDVKGEDVKQDRVNVVGIVNKILKGKEHKSLPSEIEKCSFYVFDFDYESTLINGKGDIRYTDKFDALSAIDEGFNTNVFFADNYYPQNLKSLNERCSWLMQNGYEGGILKSLDHVYECKRSKHWLKYKAVRTADLKVVGFYMGKERTKRQGLLGGLYCETEDREIVVGVGSGFKDEFLSDWSGLEADLVGKIVEVEFNEIISRSEKSYINFGSPANLTLFLPRFVSIREDKNKADNYEDLNT